MVAVARERALHDQVIGAGFRGDYVSVSCVFVHCLCFLFRVMGAMANITCSRRHVPIHPPSMLISSAAYPSLTLFLPQARAQQHTLIHVQR